MKLFGLFFILISFAQALAVPESKPPLKREQIPSLSYGGISVGNGGEGVLSEDKIFLRDLFDYGVHQSPYFGAYTEYQIENRLKSYDMPTKLGVSKDLLGRKLTDLENLRPRLGHYLLEIFDNYKWVLLDTPLNSFNDDGSPLASDIKRITVANRFQSTIRIHRDSWRKLSEEHKVALIIHEGLYSLVKPRCLDAEECYQDAYKVRDFVGQLFSGPQGSAAIKQSNLEEILLIPKDQEYSIRCATKPDELYMRMNKSRFTITDPLNPLSRRKGVQTFCSLLDLEHFRRAPEITATITLKRKPFKILKKYYPTLSSGFKHEQLYIEIQDAPGILYLVHGQDWSTVSKSECVQGLEKITEKWYSYSEISLERHPAFQCIHRDSLTDGYN